MGMGPRRKARHAVLEALYAVEMRGIDGDPSLIHEIWNYCLGRYKINEKARFFGENLYRTVLRNKPTIDLLIQKNLQNWQLSRVAIIDRNILRMGVCEILFFPDVPRKVTIDESVELAKRYSTRDSGRFVNGVLDIITEESFDELR
ncbi:MAG: transcription antitermination factor NusB [candidate division Zixibacteria bacterium]|nr:transcription antitermination factor NusB [candidate division Zixibacteria bacterium]